MVQAQGCGALTSKAEAEKSDQILMSVLCFGPASSS